jgi:hypothetical protein
MDFSDVVRMGDRVEDFFLAGVGFDLNRKRYVLRTNGVSAQSAPPSTRHGETIRARGTWGFLL